MGIPAFYRWVKERYPKCIQSVKEDVPIVVNGVKLPIDTTLPNPNGVEFDNLYLDMNGIIHPCFHPEGLPAPKTYDDIFGAVFNYIDRIFSIVRPRKLLFLAIDGVAPRAKMNQQRSRRFRVAKDVVDEASGIEQARSDLESSGDKSSLLEQSKKLDSNVITPGTEFMDLLSSALRYYVHLKMNDDLGWQGIKVILSDSSVPGEGEHKIMRYIRLQRNLLGYDPNTRHCLYGLDADLIMLALATHEIHFTILREEVRKKSGNNQVKKEKKLVKWLKKLEEKQMKGVEKKKVSSCSLEGYIMRQKFQFLNIWILREYLAHDMRIPDSNLEADLERLIDDFVFMCLFVGNDFLPQIPSLEISEGAINLLLRIYTDEFVKRGGYLTNSLEVNLERLEHFFRSVGSRERKIFLKRRRVQEKERHEKARQARQLLSNNKLVGDASKLPHVEQITGPKTSSECLAAPVCQDSQKKKSSCSETPNRSVNSTSIGRDVIVDKIKLGGMGYKERFYAEKFEAKNKDDHERIRRHAVFKYVEGVCWVMRYYYEGVCSWQWFYPYHYAPFASDFYGFHQMEIHFTLGEPFKPFDQLMGVLPAASAHALPLSYRKLMTDVSSPILEFYPTDFQVDMNGKRFSWQAICKLPFIDESRLLSEIAKVEHTLTDEERRRNSFGLDLLFLHISHPLSVEVNSFCKQINDNTKFLEVKEKKEIDPKISGGMNGYIYIADRALWPVEISSPVVGMKMITKNEVLSVFYMNPAFHTHVPRPVFGVIFPGKDVLPLDMLWLTKSARKKLSSSRRKFSKWPIPKPVIGPRLAAEPDQLMSQCNPKKLTEILPCMELGNRFGADILEEVKQEVRSKKRRWGEGVVANTYVEKLTSYSVGERRGVVGCQGLRAEVNAGVLLGIKPKLKSKKRKRRSKKWKLSDGVDVPNKGIEKLEHYSAGELSKGDGDQAIVVVLQGARTTVNLDGKVESSSLSEQKQGDGDPATVVGLQGVRTEINSDGLLGLKPDIVSTKKKRKSKKRKLSEGNDAPTNSVGKLKCSTHSELNKGGGIHVIAVGLQGDRTELNTDGKLESSSPVEQNKGCSNQVAAIGLPGVRAEVNSDGLLEIKPHLQSRKKKRKYKKRKPSKGDDVPPKSVEKLESSSVSDQNKGNGTQVIAVGLQGARTNVTTDGKVDSRYLGDRTSAVWLQGERNEVNADGLLVAKPEIKPRKKKRRSKKEKLSEGDDSLTKSVEISQNDFLALQSKGDGVRASGSGLQEVRLEVNADGKLESSSIGEKNKRFGYQACDCGLQGVGAEVNGDRSLGTKPQLDSRTRAMEGDAVTCKSVEKLESISLRDQNKGFQANVDMSQEMKIKGRSRGIKRRNKLRNRNKTDPSQGDAEEKLLFPGEKNIGNGKHAG